VEICEDLLNKILSKDS